MNNIIIKVYRRAEFLVNDYMRKNLNYKRFYNNAVNGIDGTLFGKEKLVCSLTTIPSRIRFVKYPILSMLHQTVRPDSIVLYLGKTLFEGQILPDDLLQLMDRGLEIRYVDDVRVHTKYFYAFQDFPDSLVITVDDDIIYHPKLVECLLDKHLQYPGEVICSRAHRITFNGNSFNPYHEWRWDAKSSKGDKSLIATGVGGVLYVPSMFDASIGKSDLFLKLSPNNDDLWLKAVEIMSDIKVVTLKGRQWYSELPGSQKVSLNSNNVHQNKNDLYWKQICDFYNFDKSSFTDQ